MTDQHFDDTSRSDREIPAPPGHVGPQPPAYGQQPPAYGRNDGYPAMGPELEQQLVAAAHWSPLASVLLGGLTFFGPVIVLLVNAGRSARVREHAVDALNFQLTVWLATVVGAVVSVMLMLLVVGFLTIWLVPLIPLAALVVHAIAAMQVAAGNHYRYPMTIRFIR